MGFEFAAVAGLVAGVLLAPADAHASEREPLDRGWPAQGWIDGAEAGVPFEDWSWVEPVAVIPAGSQRSIRLPAPITFRGGAYDELLVGPEPGLVVLSWSGRLPEPEAGDVPPGVGAGEQARQAVQPVGGRAWRMAPLGEFLRATPGSSAHVRVEAAAVVRWLGLVDTWGAPAAFEIIVEATGDIKYQYLQVPPSQRQSARLAGTVLTDLSRSAPSPSPSADGFAPTAGSVVVFPGDLRPDPLTGCGVATPWCTVVRALDAGCITSSGHADETTCATTQSKRWHFNEGAYCRSCPYTFYITVECGTEMHLPFKDMEGNQLRITDVFTGVELEMQAINDCAQQPFVYCDYCATGGNRITPDPNRTICPPGSPVPTRDCIPYLQRSTLIQWGYPLADRDGDTVRDDLPCGPANTATCTGSGAYAGHEEQNTDVVLFGAPALCGVFRLEVLSGGFHWFLSANCTGIVPDDPAEIARNFTVYQNCEEALRAFDPVPELVIDDLRFGGACPDIIIEIDITNIGCVDTTSSPLLLDFTNPGQPDINLDLGPVPAGTSVHVELPVTLIATPTIVTAVIDPLNIISECTEQAAGSFSGCEPSGGADRLALEICRCANTVRAEVADDSVFSCEREPVWLDARLSTALPCATGELEFRFTDPTGTVIRDWDPSSRASVVPPNCPSLRDYTVEARCSAEPLPECVDTRIITVECGLAPPITASVFPDRVCWGQPITLQASSGFISYTWEHGATGRIITEYPAATTTYRVSGRTLAGCDVVGSVTVTVDPDPIPGPIGNVLRARKEGSDVAFSYLELPVSVASYDLVVHDPAGLSPCAVFQPATDPAPITMQAAVVLDAAAPGAAQPGLRHVGGLTTCPALLFYKVLARSPCSSTAGPACDGFPLQLIPCP